MTRQEQIEEAAKSWGDKEYGDNGTYLYDEAFKVGAEWADKNPHPMHAEVIGSLNEAANLFEEKYYKLRRQLSVAVEALNGIVKKDEAVWEAHPDSKGIHSYYGEEAKEAIEKIKGMEKV